MDEISRSHRPTNSAQSKASLIESHSIYSPGDQARQQRIWFKSQDNVPFLVHLVVSRFVPIARLYPPCIRVLQAWFPFWIFGWCTNQAHSMVFFFSARMFNFFFRNCESLKEKKIVGVELWIWWWFSAFLCCVLGLCLLYQVFSFPPLISWHDVLGFVGGRLMDFFFFDMGVVKSFSAHS